MSHYRHYRDFDYQCKKSAPKSKIMGVCAGLARQFDWDVAVVRIVAVLCLLTFTAPTILAYLVAGTLFY